MSSSGTRLKDGSSERGKRTEQPRQDCSIKNYTDSSTYNVNNAGSRTGGVFVFKTMGDGNVTTFGPSPGNAGQ